MIIKITKDTPKQFSKNVKSLQNWNSKDFLIYFSQQYGDLTGHTFYIPSQGWGPLMARIKGFKEKLKLSNEDYKLFIDNVFKVFFTQKDYVPTFGAITSEKVFFVVKNLKIEVSCTNEDFESLKKELYSSDIFKKLL